MLAFLFYCIQIMLVFYRKELRQKTFFPIRIGVEVSGFFFGSFLDKVIYCTFFLIKKYQNLSADRQEIKAENHFLEIIFRLALHATQAVSQVVCSSVLAHSWVAYSIPTARQAFVISSGNAFRPGFSVANVLSQPRISSFSGQSVCVKRLTK